MKHPYIGFVLLIAVFFILMGTNAKADLLVFYNGAFLYGDVNINADQTEYVFTHPSGATETFSNRQVRNYYPNITEPANGEVLQVSDFVHSASSDVNIYDITGAITHNTDVTFPDGKELDLEIQNNFEIPAIRIQRANYAFYNQQGVYLAFRMQNNSETTLESKSFRVSIFDYNENLLANKEFYVRRFPPSTPTGRGGRVINIEVPNVLYEQIGRLRITEKF